MANSTATTNRTAMSSDQIMFHANQPCGMLAPSEPRTARLVERLVAAGHLVRKERTVRIPAVDPRWASHYAAMGLDAREHDAVIATYHAASQSKE